MKRIFIFLLFTGILMFYSGCDNLSTESEEPSNAEIKEAILTIVDGDSTVSIDNFFEEDSESPEYDYDQGVLLKVLAPQDTLPYDFRHIRFGRRLTGEPERTVEIQLQGDTAYAFVTIQFQAEFRVVYIDTADTSGEEPIPVIKPFTATSYQNLKLIRFRHTRNPRLNWRIVAVSPQLISTTNSPLQINTITISVNDIPELVLSNDESNSALDFWFDRDTLPVFHQGDTLHLAVDIENPDPFYYEPGELCLVNLGIRRHFFRFRRLLFDPENDNRFERNLRIHRRVPHICRMFVDLIDLASIFDTEAPFQSTSIGIPYRVIR